MATHVGTRSNIARTHLAPMAAAASIAPAPISLAAMYARQHTLLPEHVHIKKVKKKGNTDRLHKAMGLK